MTEHPIVLVTGARGGVGRALCAQLHAQGWRVAAVGRDAQTLAEVPVQARIAADTTTPEGAALAVAMPMRANALYSPAWKSLPREWRSNTSSTSAFTVNAMEVASASPWNPKRPTRAKLSAMFSSMLHEAAMTGVRVFCCA